MQNCNYKSSGLQSASAIIKAGPGRIVGVLFVGDTTFEPTLTIYDNASEASGTEIGFFMVSDETHAETFVYPCGGLRVKNGIYAKLSAEEGDYIIFYS